MKKFIKLSLLAAATLTATQAFAASPKWDFVELEYVQVNIDDSSLEPSGLGLTGSKLLSDNVFLTGSYIATTDDIGGVDIDLDQFDLGIGYKYAMSEQTDWYASLSYVSIEAEASAGFASSNIDEDGFGIATGIRSMLTDEIEVGVDVSYVDIDEDDETTVTLEGTYYVTEAIGLNLGYGISSDANTLNLGVRFAF